MRSLLDPVARGDRPLDKAFVNGYTLKALATSGLRGGKKLRVQNPIICGLRGASAAALWVAISFGWTGSAFGGGFDDDLGSNLTPMPIDQDWVFQTFWSWALPPNDPPPGNDDAKIFQLASALEGRHFHGVPGASGAPSEGFDIFELTGQELPSGQFKVIAGDIEDPFGFRAQVGDPFQLDPDTEHKLTVHYRSDAERMDFWINDDLVLPDIVGPGYSACTDFLAYLFADKCVTPPHAVGKIQFDVRNFVNIKPRTPNGAGDTFGPTMLGPIDPNGSADQAPAPMLIDEAPGLNIPIEPMDRDINDVVVDWGSLNNFGQNWDISTGKLTSQINGAAIRLQTTLRGDGVRIIRGDINGDGTVDNLDITGFIIALGIGGDARGPVKLDEFRAQWSAGGPDIVFRAADMQRDNNVNNLDITDFIDVLVNAAVTGSMSAAPEPASLVLLLAPLTVMRRTRCDSIQQAPGALALRSVRG